jgi:hypothetical protein
MTRLFQILNKKLTLGTIGASLASLVFCIGLKYLYEYLYLVSPIRGGISVHDLSFFAIIISFKIIFSALLEYFLEDKFYITISDYFPKEKTDLFMTERDKTNSSSSDTSKGKGKDSSSDTSKGKGKDSSNNPLPKLPIDEELELMDNMQKNLYLQIDMISKLRGFESQGVTFIDDKGNLDIEVPADFSDEKANKIAKEVGIIDRILQTKFSEYKELEKKDATLNGNRWNDVFKDGKATNKNDYKNLFKSNKR